MGILGRAVFREIFTGASLGTLLFGFVLFPLRLNANKSSDGEIAAMQVGASIWGVANQTVETKSRSHIFEKPYVIGNRYGYPQGGGRRNENLKDSPVAGLARAG